VARAARETEPRPAVPVPATIAGRPTTSPGTSSVPTDRSGLAGRRVLVGFAAGLAATGAAVALEASWSVAALVGLDVAAIVFIAWVWIGVGRSDTEATARIARAEDASRAASEAVRIGAAGASLIVVGFTLSQASHNHAPARGLLTALALMSVALAWSSLHTAYALRYARLYYSPPVGGIDFHGDCPDYRDFAYLALTIGMTFQVSDTGLTGKRIRRTALHHALASYLFGTVIVAITVGAVAAVVGG
jgi:uncharacterized membrane protein